MNMFDACPGFFFFFFLIVLHAGSQTIQLPFFQLHPVNVEAELSDDQKWKTSLCFGGQTWRYLRQESATASAEQHKSRGQMEPHTKYLTNKISLLPRIVFSLKVEETSNEIYCWGNVCHMRCGATAWKLLIILWEALFLASFLPFRFRLIFRARLRLV